MKTLCIPSIGLQRYIKHVHVKRREYTMRDYTMRDYTTVVRLHEKAEKTINALEVIKQGILSTKAVIAKQQIVLKVFTLLDMAQFDIQETGKIIFIISLLRLLHKKSADHLYPFYTEQILFLLTLSIF